MNRTPGKGPGFQAETWEDIDFENGLSSRGCEHEIQLWANNEEPKGPLAVLRKRVQ